MSQSPAPENVCRPRGPKRALGVVARAVSLSAAGLALCGCFGTDPTLADTTAAMHLAGVYPATVADFGRYDKFPAEVAGYRRGPALRYAPGLAHYSISYGRDDATLVDDVSLFFYPRMNDIDAQLRTEEAEVLQTHRAVRLVSRKTIRLERDGAGYEARVTNFEYDDLFHGRVQPLASQLLVVFRAQGVFKLRSTAPLAQATQAEGAMLQLLQGVAWDAPEAFVGS